ncbi:hypothetical protein [Cribrihabitans pelagius]|uniref:hypothetical protein n=1 Tax=Cribrihabitans pelagius TaxID=1765746 RepID=UPI003B5BA9E8
MHTSERAQDTNAATRHVLVKQGLPEDEHFFFRREMHIAGKIGSISQRLPCLLFGQFSEYGYSILRPTLWLLGIWAMGLSFSSVFPLFGFGRTFPKEELGALPAVLQYFPGIQTVAGLPLLFFAGLGLRQRFRLR